MSAKNVTSSGFKFEEPVFIDRNRHELLRAGTLERGDVVMTTRGTIGNIAFYNDSIAYPTVRINSGMMIFRADPKVWNRRFLYYVLTSNIVQEQITSLTSGSAVPQLPARDLRKFELPKVPIEIQNKIEKVISSISDKLKSNQQINQTLEQMAQAIFKSWFVDFEPVKAKIAALEVGGSDEDALFAAMQAISGKNADQLATMQADQFEQYAELRATAELFPSAMQESELGEIPEGWSIGNVGKLANAKGGYAFKSKQFSNVGFPVLKIKNITGNGTVNLNDCQCIDSTTASLVNRFKLSDGDLVMAMTGATVGKTGLVVSSGEDIYLNQRVAKFESKKFGSEIGYFLFCLFKRKSTFDELVGAAQGSAQPNISSSGIEMARLVVPKDELVIRFINTCRPIFNFWMNSERQNFKLAEARDALLPKLLSGELEV